MTTHWIKHTFSSYLCWLKYGAIKYRRGAEKEPSCQYFLQAVFNLATWNWILWADICKVSVHKYNEVVWALQRTSDRLGQKDPEKAAGIERQNMSQAIHFKINKWKHTHCRTRAIVHMLMVLLKIVLLSRGFCISTKWIKIGGLVALFYFSRASSTAVIHQHYKIVCLI